jgi:acyl carrier protein
MNREQIRGVLKTIFEEETGQELAVLEDDAVLSEDFAFDSVDLVSLLMRVEGHFHVRLTNAELTESRTVGALLDLVARKVNEAPSSADSLRAAA